MYATAFAVLVSRDLSITGFTKVRGNLDYVEFLSPDDTRLRLLAQNPEKDSWCAALARQGWKIAWGVKITTAICSSCGGAGTWGESGNRRCFRCKGTGDETTFSYTGVCVFLKDDNIIVGDRDKLYKMSR